MTDILDPLTAAAAVERQKLQRHFGRFDIAVGVLFWWLGRRTRVQAAEAAPEPAG
ncbi:MAG TPA: hypothetical protein VHO07_21615 [Streptosporangiaceae bacterium]|jgi:hypothetical protein|nr:hypothetical protein [Streptosporangiaceae bacterium]